jgi:tetratricopeptide (TPR) repeat protein
MTIWSAEIRELEKLYESLKGQFPDLEKELEQLIQTTDANVVMLYSRRCLEVIITDLCECELKRPRKTEPLKGIIDKLHKEGKVPSHIITSMHGLNELSTYGTHPKDFDPEQIKPVLNNLDIIIKWYLKYKQIVTIGKTEDEKEKVQLRKEPLEKVKIEERTEVQEKYAKAGKRKLISIVALVAIIIIAAIFAYPKIFKRDTLEKLRSSGEPIIVDVMPFQNMTNDTTWNVWQDGIQTNLITSLSNSDELKVRQVESLNSIIQGKGLTNYASITPSVASNISQKLDANVFIYGSINQTGSTIRLNSQLVDSKTEDILKSFQIDGKIENILYAVDSLSAQIKNFLIISKLIKENTPDIQKYTTTPMSPQAYKFFMDGRNELSKGHYEKAISNYLQAIKIDSNFADPYLCITWAYNILGRYEDAKKWYIKAYEKKNLMSTQEKIDADVLHSLLFETLDEAIGHLKQQLEYDDQQPIVYNDLGYSYSALHQYDKAIAAFQKSLEIYNKWGVKPFWTDNYEGLAMAYHKIGQYKKMKKVIKKGEQDFPDDPWIIYRWAIWTSTEGDTIAANDYIKKFISLSKERSVSEADIKANIAGIYSLAGIPARAEEYYRQALSLEPENPDRMNALGYFLIDKDRNINEGLELVGKALKLSPVSYYMLDTKGWGLYKQGKYQEALDILQKSWDIRTKNAIYNHEAFLHLEAAKKAVAGLKNN